MKPTDPGADDAYLYIYILRDGAGPEYDRRHREVWPRMLRLLERAGIYDYQIWRRDELVVCRMRAREGYAEANATLHANDVQREWSSTLADLFESIADESGAPLWLTEVFRFDMPDIRHEIERP